MMLDIHLRLYEELNDFLPVERRRRRFAYRLDRTITVGELLADLGVPCGEVEFVLVNGDSAEASRLLKDGDFVSIFPILESLDASPLVRLRNTPLRRIRFLAGKELARLAFCLRLLGFDTLVYDSWRREEIVRTAEKDRRILLTRESDLMTFPDFSRVCLLKETKPLSQLKEIIFRLDFHHAAHFSWFQSMIVHILALGNK